MTMLPIYKICPVCKRRYSWNPDVGKIFCPRCKAIEKTFEPLIKLLKNRMQSLLEQIRSS